MNKLSAGLTDLWGVEFTPMQLNASTEGGNFSSQAPFTSLQKISYSSDLFDKYTLENLNSLMEVQIDVSHS